jgi:hypothetical protein
MGMTGNRLAAVWAGVVVLVGAQLWEVIRIRRLRARPAVDTR